jgi:predicted dienelactone hydrolase
MCHGLGGDHHGYATLGKHLASHGYAVLHPQFLDSAALNSIGEPARDMLFDPRHWASRVTRVKAVINSLATQQHLPVRLRNKDVLVAGHSFGAYTAQLLIGTRLSDADNGNTHPAITAAILLSPQGSGDRGLTKNSWDEVDRPILVVTATNDTGANGEGLDWRREPFDRARSRLKHLTVVRDGDHQLGGLPTAKDQEPGADVRAAIAAVATAFADRVHGDQRAGQWLAADPLPTLLDHGHREDTAWTTP